MTSALKVKAIAEKSTIPGDQVRLKREFETIQDEANQQIIRATEDKKTVEDEIEILDEEKESKLSAIEAEEKVQIEEQSQKSKL